MEICEISRAGAPPWVHLLCHFHDAFQEVQAQDVAEEVTGAERADGIHRYEPKGPVDAWENLLVCIFVPQVSGYVRGRSREAARWVEIRIRRRETGQRAVVLT